MCQQCVDGSAQQISAQFGLAIQAIPLLRTADLKAANLELKTSGFGAPLRDFVIGKLPKLPAQYTPVQCSYCGKLKDARSVELDHIIPMRPYVRLKLLTFAQRLSRGEHRLTEQHATLLANMAFADPANLTFACKACNGIKSDRFPDDVRVNRGEGGGLRAFDRFKESAAFDGRKRREVLQLQNDLRAIKAGDAVGRFCRGEVSFVRSTPRRAAVAAPIQVAPSGPRKRKLDAILPDGDGNEGLARSLRVAVDDLAIIHFVMTSLFTVSRPSIRHYLTYAYDRLLKAQTRDTVEKSLRVCLYCQGLFHKQAFDIEHVSPVLRNAFGQHDASKNRYNDRLIAICRTCNRARGSQKLSMALLTELQKKRADEELPGIEAICKDLPALANTHAKAILGL